ncbi:response regulator [Magnetovibrio sp.]|uniref:response regulator n=1 Tax=Magnetovibrio sp. TaxID=2024836 RepID=UPI002F932E38
MKSKTILCVDDDKLLLGLVRVVVEDLGARFIGAEDGEACLTVMQNLEPDLLILDVQMEGMSGVDLLERIRQAHPRLKSKVIFLTAQKSLKTIEKTTELGSTTYILKPIDPHRLHARIREVLSPTVNSDG